jgi:predicted metalloprotease
MRWDDLEKSDNVEDRRGESYGGGGGGGGFGLPIGGGGLGIGAIVVLGLLGWALGIDPRLLIGGAEILSGGGSQVQPYQPGGGGGGGGQARRTGAPSDDIGGFVSRILGSTEVQWKAIFQQAGQNYRPPILVLYQRQTEARCGGMAQSAMGPFYCPNDQKVYLDTSFFREIETRFHGCDVGSRSCQFSQAYVIAHEVGHHVQNLLGILPKVQQQQQGIDRTAANHLQVQVELQADCFAGIWANHENQRQLKEGHPAFIEAGDVEAALKTASAIGDDTLQRQATGRVVPDSFTHGSAEQRQRWFSAGLKEGSVAACDTFRAARL